MNLMNHPDETTSPAAPALRDRAAEPSFPNVVTQDDTPYSDQARQELAYRIADVWTSC